MTDEKQRNLGPNPTGGPNAMAWGMVWMFMLLILVRLDLEIGDWLIWLILPVSLVFFLAFRKKAKEAGRWYWR